ncbi:MAG: CvpA family protein, partial [Amylibacter sp.]
MEGFTLVDGGVAVIILISAILAYSRGLVREILSIAGWVVAAIAAYMLTPMVEPLLKEVPILSDFISGSCVLSLIIAFAVVFAIALIVVSIFTPLFSGMIQKSALGGIDQGLGFLFGVA